MDLPEYQVLRRTQSRIAGGTGGPYPPSPAEIKEPDIPEGRNAATLYDRVLEFPDSPSTEPGKGLPFLDSQEQTLLADFVHDESFPTEKLAQVRSVLQRPEVVEALGKLKKASGMENADFATGQSIAAAQTLAHALAYVPDMRDAARMALAVALVRAESGDIENALSWCGVGLNMGKHAAQEELLTPFLAGMAIRGMALSTLRRIARQHHLPAEAASRTARDLRDVAPLTEFGTAVGSEVAYWHAYFARMQKDPDAIHGSGRNRSTRLPQGTMASVSKNFLLRPWLRANQVAYLRMMRKFIRAAQLPATEAYPMLEKVGADLGTNPLSVMAGIMFPVMQRARKKAGVLDAKIRVAEAAMRLHAFRDRHGHYPAALSALARVPTDPFSGKSLTYHLTDGQATVYSIGDNFTDDGGDGDDIAWELPR